MTPEEWQKRMDNCQSKAELEYLLKNKPAGLKTIGTGPVIEGGVPSGRPLLDQLERGKK